MTTQPENICPVCGGYVSRQDDGLLFPHFRYSDSGGPATGQDHIPVPCEGNQSAQAPACPPAPQLPAIVQEALEATEQAAARTRKPARVCPECHAHEGSGANIINGVAAAHHPQCGTPESPWA